MQLKIIPAIREAYAEECNVARIVWEDGTSSRVNLQEWLHRSEWFAPVSADKKVWESLRVGAWGGYIEWDGCSMEVPSSTLWRLQLEQT